MKLERECRQCPKCFENKIEEKDGLGHCKNKKCRYLYNIQSSNLPQNSAKFDDCVVNTHKRAKYIFSIMQDALKEKEFRIKELEKTIIEKQDRLKELEQLFSVVSLARLENKEKGESL